MNKPYFCWNFFLKDWRHKHLKNRSHLILGPISHSWSYNILFLVLHFSYYTLMTFLTILSVILLSMLMILLSILSVIRHLICGRNLNWLLNLNLIYEILCTGVRKGLLASMLGKLSWFCLTGLTTMVLLMWKRMGLLLRKNHLLRY